MALVVVAVSHRRLGPSSSATTIQVIAALVIFPAPLGQARATLTRAEHARGCCRTFRVAEPLLQLGRIFVPLDCSLIGGPLRMLASEPARASSSRQHAAGLSPARRLVAGAVIG